jgi:hypothetical protein
MPRTHPQQPLTVACELCGDRLPTTYSRAAYDAIDHGIDVHRVQLLGAPELWRRWFRITHTAIGRPARLAPVAR